MTQPQENHKLCKECQFEECNGHADTCSKRIVVGKGNLEFTKKVKKKNGSKKLYN